MKILKTLAVLFVLLVLTVGAVAEEGFAPYTAEELQAMTITLPVGMAEAVTDTKYSDGLVQIYVDSDKVKWDYVAAQSTEESGAEIVITTVIPENAKGHRTLMGNAGKLEDMWTFMMNDFNGGQMSSVSSEYIPTGSTKITSYSVESNTVTPLPYKLLLMQGWYSVYGDNSSLMGNNSENKLPRYALFELVYTDNSSVKIEDIGVPSGRITLDSNAGEDSYKSSGVVAYVLPSDNEIKTLTTTISMPDGAVDFMTLADGVTNENGKVSIPMTNIGTDDYYASKTVSLLWYKEDGTVLDAERIVITVEVGDPIVWPNYIEKENFTKADVKAYFIKDGSNVSTGYMTAEYSANSGTVTVSANASIASANEDMTKYGLRVELTPPEGAAYGTSYSVVSTNMIGKNPNGYTLDGIWNMYEGLMEVVKDAKQGDEAYVEIVGGKAYFDDILFKETSYRNDPGLTVYYDANQTSESAATLQLIDWRNKDGAAIGRQWVAVQYQPMAYTKPVDIEASAPANATTPVLVAETAVEGYTLRVRSYPQTSETETQIHYELEQVDEENGTSVSLNELNTDVQLLLPYQTEGGKNDETVVYTVNHYNANGGLKESATEANDSVTLERVEGGLLMTIKSLSPFVLSYVEAECKHTELTYAYSRNSITEACMGCDHKATWTIEVEESCVAGTEIGYQITCEGDLIAQLSVAYYNEKANEITSEMPTEPGKYSVIVGIVGGDWILDIPFTVVAAPAMPATGDRSLPLAALLVIAALATTTAFALRRKATRA